MKVIEKFKNKNFPADRLKDLEQDLSENAVEIVAGGHYHFDDHTPMGTRIPYLKNFLTTYSKENTSYTIAIGLYSSPFTDLGITRRQLEMLETGLGLSREPKERDYMDLEMTLESITLGEGELKPSSIKALNDLIEKYGFVEAKE